MEKRRENTSKNRSTDKRGSSSRKTRPDKKEFRGPKPERKSGSSNDENEKKPWSTKTRTSRSDKPESDRPAYKKRFDQSDDEKSEKRPWKSRTEKSDSDKPMIKKRAERGSDDRNERKSYSPRTGSDKPAYKKSLGRGNDENAEKSKWSDRPRKPRSDKGFDGNDRGSKPSENSTDENRRGNSRNNSPISTKNGRPFMDQNSRTRSFDKSIKKKPSSFSKNDSGETRLNKYIANSGICSRREADVLISTGVVKVNDEIVVTMGYKVKPGDKVTVDGRELKSEKKVYILLNKPKDTITTTDDPSGRTTVMDIVKDACRERVYPVGRLDRNTTGLLLLTNDGDMAKRLMHPSHKIVKVYEVTLDKNVTKEDMLIIGKGVTIDDDFIPVDGIAWPEPDKKNVVGIELHSGKYHVVKRIFEQCGYDVIKLDRTMFGPLTKKNLPRGTYRFLSDSEISILYRL